MKKFWNWIHDDSGGRVLRLEGPIDNESFWGDEITPAMFRDDLEAEEGDVTVWRTWTSSRQKRAEMIIT